MNASNKLLSDKTSYSMKKEKKPREEKTGLMLTI